MDKFLKRAENFKYISFDIFDTLIKRDVTCPKDVFDLVDRKYREDYPASTVIDNFRSNRVEAEAEARRKSERAEITLDEIYDELARRFPKEVCVAYQQIEKEIEVLVCTPNQRVIEAFNSCLKEGKKVFIITDMYLPKDIIEQILHKCGVAGYHKLYLSCDYFKTKSIGSLYDLVLNENHIPKNQLLHIGDNFKSDYIQAKLHGVDALLLKTNKESTNSISLSDLLKVFIKNHNRFSDFYSSFGYGVFGPMLYGYSKWLDDKFSEHGYDYVLFFSREGYFIKKAYEVVHSLSGPSRMYFYASRRALQVPAIWIKPEYSCIMKSMFLPREFTLDWLINHWGLNTDKYTTCIGEVGLAKETKLSKFSVLENSQVEKLYELLKDDIYENSKSEYSAFIDYLKVNHVQGNVAIVDIGWNGNMQKAFTSIVSKANYPIKITGYYLGSRTASGNYKYQSMNGYLHDKDTLYADFLLDYYAETLIELLFMAPHGSVIRYLDSQNVEMDQFEYGGTSTLKAVKSIQNAALEFLKDYQELGSLMPNDSFVYSEKLLSVLRNPSSEEANKLGDLSAWDHGWIPMAEKLNACNMVKLKETKGRFLDNSWKIGFMKRNFKINAPYFIILKTLRQQALSKENSVI